MKKLICLLLAVMALAAMMVVPANAAENPTITMVSSQACPGKDITVDISISGNPGFGTCLLALEYDEDVLELKDITMGLFGDNAIANADTGKVAFVAVKNLTGNGVLCSAVFKVKADAADVSDVKVLVEEMTNDNGDIKPAVVNGKVTVGHIFTDYKSNNDATCQKDGTKTAVCDNGCGAKDTVTDTGSKSVTIIPITSPTMMPPA